MYCANGRLNEIKPLFECFDDSLLISFFDGIFGNAYCDNLENPKCAFVCAGDFFFIAGDFKNEEFSKQAACFINERPQAVVVPDNINWQDSLNKFGKKLIKVERFHTTQPEKGFDTEKLEKIKNKVEDFPEISLCRIDEKFYNKALEHQWSESFVCNFKNFDDYSEHGFGYIITDGENILSGTSSFSYYKGGVEIEVATDEPCRMKGYAQITSAAFILECIKRNLTPHWDARNEISISIAKKMGFVFKDKYAALEFEQSSI